MLNSNVLRKLDMQDLMVFVAVYEQNSVSGVSETLCVSQSTVSYCLKKLRAGFEDELFINTRAGMRPTYKADSMYPHVLKILDSINLCQAAASAFDPTLQPTVFNLCAPEYFEQLVLPRLLKRFALAGLAVAINVHKLESDIPTEALREGSLDLAIGFGPDFHRSHGDFHVRTLLQARLRLRQPRHPGATPPEPADVHRAPTCVSDSLDIHRQHGRRLVGAASPTTANRRAGQQLQRSPEDDQRH